MKEPLKVRPFILLLLLILFLLPTVLGGLWNHGERPLIFYFLSNFLCFPQMLLYGILLVFFPKVLISLIRGSTANNLNLKDRFFFALVGGLIAIISGVVLYLVITDFQNRCSIFTKCLN